MPKTIAIKNSDEPAIVDDSDYEYVSRFRWALHPKGYAQRTVAAGLKHRTVLMHREIMNTPKGLQTDHVNLNKLDNRKSNLRVCTSSENKQNQRAYANNKSGYKGVSWNANKKKWTAQIKAGGRVRNLGSFLALEDAARTYDLAASRYFGEYAQLNMT